MREEKREVAIPKLLPGLQSPLRSRRFCAHRYCISVTAYTHLTSRVFSHTLLSIVSVKGVAER